MAIPKYTCITQWSRNVTKKNFVVFFAIPNNQPTVLSTVLKQSAHVEQK